MQTLYLAGIVALLMSLLPCGTTHAVEVAKEIAEKSSIGSDKASVGKKAKENDHKDRTKLDKNWEGEGYNIQDPCLKQPNLPQCSLGSTVIK